MHELLSLVSLPAMATGRKILVIFLSALVRGQVDENYVTERSREEGVDRREILRKGSKHRGQFELAAPSSHACTTRDKKAREDADGVCNNAGSSWVKRGRGSL